MLLIVMVAGSLAHVTSALNPIGTGDISMSPSEHAALGRPLRGALVAVVMPVMLSRYPAF